MGAIISNFCCTGHASSRDVASMHQINGFWKSVFTSGVYQYAFDLEIIVTALGLAGVTWLADMWFAFTFDIDNIHTFLNLLMACLSVHRLNTAASRWWEARCAWQTMVGDVRFLVCRIFSSGYKDPQLAQAFTAAIAMYPYCVKQRLTDPENAYFVNRENIKEFLSTPENLKNVCFPGDPDGDLWKCIYHEQEEEDDRKLYGFMGTKLLEAAQIMIYKADNFRINDEVGAITDVDATQLSENLHNLARQFGTCMKIAETPLLAQISGFVRFLYIFMILINAIEIGSNTELSTEVGCLAIFVTTLLILCFDKIVVGLERPFNPALPTSLDLTKYCQSVRIQTTAALKVYAKYYTSYAKHHDSKLMSNLYDTMTCDYKTALKRSTQNTRHMSQTLRDMEEEDSLEALTKQKEIDIIKQATIYTNSAQYEENMNSDDAKDETQTYDMSPVMVKLDQSSQDMHSSQNRL